MATTFTGTTGRDNLVGGADNDLIEGLGGNDALSGGWGDDTLAGGAGNDRLNGDSGLDTAVFTGNVSEYTIHWDQRRFTVTDSIAGRDGSDSASVEFLQFADVSLQMSDFQAPDQLGSDGADTLVGTSIADRLDGASGDDLLLGNEGSDHLMGGGEQDTLEGGAGADSLDGGEGSDLLAGGDGDDFFFRSGGNDTLDGAAGVDTYLANWYQPGLVVNLATGVAMNALGIDLLAGIENAFGAADADDITGNELDNHLVGWGGNDSLRGAGGNDFLVGEYGDDQLWGEDGDDLLAGDEQGIQGKDTMYGGTGDDTLAGYGGDDLFFGGDGLDIAVYWIELQYHTGWFNDDGSVSVSNLQFGYPSGTDTLYDVERLYFRDAIVALDLDGNGGAAIRMVGAALGSAAASDPNWLRAAVRLYDAGWTDAQVAGLAVDELFGGANDAEFVDRLYANVVGDSPDAHTQQHFVGMLEAGTTRAELLTLAAQSEVNAEAVGLAGLKYFVYSL